MVSIAILSSILIMVGIALLFGGVMVNRKPDAVQSRLNAFAMRPRTLEEIELQLPFSDRVLKPVIVKLAKLVSSKTPQSTVEQLRHDIMVAGSPNNLQVNDFLGIKGLVAIALAVLAMLLMVATNAPFVYKVAGPLIMLILGFYLPNFWLKSKISKRQGEIQKSLPDCLDLLVISVEAGLGFDAAIQKVTEKWNNALTHEFTRVLAETRMGKHRREALRDMALRVEVADVTSFIAAIIQADQLGVSISRILQIQSEQMRMKRRQRAEKLAHEAPVKMLIPMALFMLPTIYLVILGPMVPKLLNMFGGK